MSASSEFRTARFWIIPSHLAKRIHEIRPIRRPAPGGRPDQQVAVDVDSAALASLAAGKAIQIIPRDRFEPALVPSVEHGHEMTGEAGDDRIGIDHLETFAQQRHTGGGLHLVHMRHIRGAQYDAEHQPRGHLGLRTILGPTEPSAAEQAAVKFDGVGPVEADLPLRWAVGGNRVCHGVHPGKQRPARRHQRLGRLQNDGEFDQIIAPHPNQGPGPRLRRDIAAMRERVA